MKKFTFSFVLAIIFTLSLNSCKTTCCHNITPVSFGVNSSIINTVTTTKVYVDGNEIGVIPGSVNSVENCENENTLNVEFGESEHRYEIVVFNEQNDTIAKKNGYFDVNDGDCIKIFFDLNE
ncbi:MAG: hypothetical protein JXL97_07885 [Bacteroidales bacterium]|nr:hypothetical protein [Bacteroidales bacterium]